MRQTIPSNCEQNKNKRRWLQSVFCIPPMATYIEPTLSKR